MWPKNRRSRSWALMVSQFSSSSISKPKLGLNWATKIFRQLAIGRDKLGFNWATKFFLQPYVGKIRPELGSKKNSAAVGAENLALTGLQFVWAAVGSEIRPQLGFQKFCGSGRENWALTGLRKFFGSGK